MKTIKITPYETPWEVACKIINAKYEGTNIFNQKIIAPFFDLAELQKIGEHIANYCKAEERRES